ncbi:EamA family transporter [Vibrio sonorensis]|uniref:EamA family transporter n=1 Tax=Vibrio sonorensis TaxID=1004316 RepID=UPI0008DA5BE2|nr:EamA family transporter [Vibrio sonorensis]
MTRTWLANLLFTALTPIIWGSTYIVTTELLPENMPLLASAIRALPSGLLLVIFARSLPKGDWWGKLFLLGALNIGLFFYCLFYAAYHLPGGMAALVMSGTPLVVIAISAIVLKTSLDKNQVFAALIGIGGMALLVLNSAVTLHPLGVALGLLGTICMALGVVLTKKWGRPEGMSLLGFTGWQLTFGGVLIFPVALWQEGLPAQLTSLNIAGYSYLCLMGSVIAYAIWFRGIEKLPTVTVSFLGFLSPLSAVILGYLFLDEALTPIQCGGALAILSAISLANSKGQKKPDTVQLKTMKVK